MRTYASSRVKRKSFYRKNPEVIVDFRWPYWCTKTVHQYGVSIQSSTKVRDTFRQITQKLWATETPDLDKLFKNYSFITFHLLGFVCWTVSSLFFCCVTVKTIYIYSGVNFGGKMFICGYFCESLEKSQKLARKNFVPHGNLFIYSRYLSF